MSCEVIGYYFILGCLSNIILVVVLSKPGEVSLSCIFVIKVSKTQHQLDNFLDIFGCHDNCQNDIQPNGTV